VSRLKPLPHRGIGAARVDRRHAPASRDRTVDEVRTGAHRGRAGGDSVPPPRRNSAQPTARRRLRDRDRIAAAPTPR